MSDKPDEQQPNDQADESEDKPVPVGADKSTDEIDVNEPPNDTPSQKTDDKLADESDENTDNKPSNEKKDGKPDESQKKDEKPAESQKIESEKVVANSKAGQFREFYARLVCVDGGVRVGGEGVKFTKNTIATRRFSVSPNCIEFSHYFSQD